MIEKRENHNYADGRLGCRNYKNEILEEWRVNGVQSTSAVSGFGQKQGAPVGAASVEVRHGGVGVGGLLDCSVAR